MSLINEALKKAQRARVEDQPATDAPPVPGGSTIAKRGRAKSANTMVLMVAGALALVVVSVVATVYLVNRPAATDTKIAATTPTPTTSPAPATTPTPVTTAPSPAPATTPPPAKPVESTPVAVTTPAATTSSTATPATTPPPVATAPAVAAAPSSASPTAPAASTTPAAPAPAATTTASAPTPRADAKPDERVTAFIDSIRVTATRAAEGRVLMNDRVYRLNEIVERTLGIRLTKVAIDNLTFTDANGVEYVKYF